MRRAFLFLSQIARHLLVNPDLKYPLYPAMTAWGIRNERPTLAGVRPMVTSYRMEEVAITHMWEIAALKDENQILTVECNDRQNASFLGQAEECLSRW